MNNRISIASDGLTMKELLTDALCAASMMLAGYATMSKPSTRTAAEIGAAIDRALDAYDRISATPEVMLPSLSPERAARILAMSLAKGSLLPARHTATAAAQLAALKQAEAATTSIQATAAESRS
jgi:hypothetical protein